MLFTFLNRHQKIVYNMGTYIFGDIGLMNRESANGLEDQSSIPGRHIP